MRAQLLAGSHGSVAAVAAFHRYIEARAAAAEVLRIEPNWTNLGTGAAIYVFRRPEDAEHLWDGLRKAGLPD